MKLEEIKVSVEIYHQQSHILPFEFLIPALAVLETLTLSSFNPLKKGKYVRPCNRSRALPYKELN